MRSTPTPLHLAITDGLFGPVEAVSTSYLRETRKEIVLSVPTIGGRRIDGIDRRDPLPADPGFPAGRGDYDVIVGMDEDQGYGPVKILGIETRVNITVGLAVIHTSVLHSTAFDVAGHGVVEIGSMIEALRRTAQTSVGDGLMDARHASLGERRRTP